MKQSEINAFVELVDESLEADVDARAKRWKLGKDLVGKVAPKKRSGSELPTLTSLAIISVENSRLAKKKQKGTAKQIHARKEYFRSSIAFFKKHPTLDAALTGTIRQSSQQKHNKRVRLTPRERKGYNQLKNNFSQEEQLHIAQCIIASRKK